MIASRALVHPITLLAIAVLIVNDHVLKAAMPGLVTGKLSDVAGMMFFPLALAAAAEQLGLRRGFAAIAIATIVTGVVFAAIKLWDPAGDLYRHAIALLQWPFRALATMSLPEVGRGRLVADPTDLIALGALVVPVWLARRVKGAVGDIGGYSTRPVIAQVR